MNILRKLDEFQGLSRFTTWAYKFVIVVAHGPDRNLTVDEIGGVQLVER